MVGYAGPLAELTGDHVLIGEPGQPLHLVDVRKELIVYYMALDQDVLAITAAAGASVAYLLMADQCLWSYDLVRPEPQQLTRVAHRFGITTGHGLFVLPASRRVVGVFDPADQRRSDTSPARPPPASGPAVDPRDDAWYFAGREILRFSVTRLSIGPADLRRRRPRDQAMKELT